MGYKVRVLKTEEGYAVWVPGLPGCCSQGATEEEALENTRDAILDYIEVAAEVPAEPGSHLREVTVA